VPIMPSDIRIRKACLKDIKSVAELALLLLRYHSNFDPYFLPGKDAGPAYEKYFRSCVLSRKKLLLIAEKNNRIIGYSLSHITERPSVFQIRDIGLIDDMFLISNFRRQGVGRLFLQEISKWFKSKGIKHVELIVHSANDIGNSVWNKFGFKDFMIKKRGRI